MAKVIVNYDGDTDQMDVTINGQAVADVRQVYFEKYPSWEDPSKVAISCMVETYNKGDDGVTRMTRLLAKDSPAGRDAFKAGAKLHAEFRDFVVIGDSDKFQQDIAAYFSRG